MSVTSQAPSYNGQSSSSQAPYNLQGLARTLDEAAPAQSANNGQNGATVAVHRSASSSHNVSAPSSVPFATSAYVRAPSQLPSQASTSAGTSESTPTRSSTATPSAAAPRNPLIDLLETEKCYVDELAMVIKKVAAAWSRSNFPPPALDSMFRAVEAVYRIDKQFLAKLTEIGPNPSSPKALGDLLMRWIDDLEPAYTRYVKAYHTGFDTYTPVQSNPNLLPILENLPPLRSADIEGHPTLDALFSLPLLRLDYYKRLYAKLLKATQPGKSDHGLLVGANEKLDALLDAGAEAAERAVGAEQDSRASQDKPGRDDLAGPLQASGASSSAQMQARIQPTAATARSPPPVHQPQQTGSLAPLVLSSTTSQNLQDQNAPAAQEEQSSSSRVNDRPPVIPPLEAIRNERPSSNRTSNSGSSVERSSGQTIASATSTNLTSDTSATQIYPSNQLLDIERRLDTSRTLDIFTMKPKKCKLQINPPNLPYQRTLRRGGDVQVSFTPASDPDKREVFTAAAYIFLLTDLFLLCERMPTQLQGQQPHGPGAASDMWLMYPPLATKHLKVNKVEDSYGNALEIEIMRKERMTVFADNRQSREDWYNHFISAISFAGPQHSLRVDTNTSRQASPTSASPSPGTAMQQTMSPQSWQSGSTSSYPHLPLSASQPSFGQSARAPTPHDQRQSAGDPGYGRQSPAQFGSPLARPLPSPSQQSFQQPQPAPASYGRQPGYPAANHGLPQQPYNGLPHPSQSPQHLQQQQQQHPQYQHQLMTPQNNLIQGVLANGQANRGLPLPPTPPHPQPAVSASGLRSAPSTMSMNSASSRSSKTSAPSSFSTTPSGPIPPLPFKDGHPNYRGQSGGGGHQPGLSASRSLHASAGAASHSGLLSPNSSEPMAMHRSRSAEGLRQEASSYRMPSSVLKEQLRGNSLPSSTRPGYPPTMPPSLPGSRMGSGYLANNQQDEDVSPPSSPKLANVTSQLAAQMKCKVFIQQAHGQWKSLGTAKLKLYLQSPTNQKQLVVEGDKAVLISTIVLEDGVERVGKTGVAIELSDNGSRTGIVYMLQLKTEQSATGLFGQLIMGSSRASAIAVSR